MNNEMNKYKKTSYAAPAVIRAFEILKLMADSTKPLSLTAINT